MSVWKGPYLQDIKILEVSTQTKIKAGKLGWLPGSVPRITRYCAEWGKKPRIVQSGEKTPYCAGVG